MTCIYNIKWISTYWVFYILDYILEHWIHRRLMIIYIIKFNPCFYNMIFNNNDYKVTEHFKSKLSKNYYNNSNS